MDDYIYIEQLIKNCVKSSNKDSKECLLFHSEFKKFFSLNF